MKSKTLILLGSFSIILGVKATILPVPGTYSTIQSAITASSNGDTIAVSPGTYYENINFRGKNVLLTSLYYLANDTSYILSTIINGSTPVHPDTASCVIFNSGEDSTAILQGFTITGGSGTKWQDIHGAGLYREGGGILIELSAPTIRHNQITNNQATNTTGVTSCGGGGMRIGDSNPDIYGNVISNNQGRYGPGIVLNYTGCKIRNNIIFANTGGQDYNGGSGIWILNNHLSTPKIIENNTIVNNASSLSGGTGGILLWSAANVMLRNNIIRDNIPLLQILNVGSTAVVLYCDVKGGYPGSGNIDLDPFFTSQSYLLSGSSPCIDAGDSTTIYNDPEDPGDPGHALFPSMGLLRNDIGAYGGPLASLFPSFATITGIAEIKSGNSFFVFPNPFSTEATLTTKTPLQNVTLTLVNPLGQVVREAENINGQQVTIQRGNLQSGIYFIRITRNQAVVGNSVIIIE
jgi:hypothetical protein